MQIAAVLSLLSAVFKAVPTIEIWWERLVVLWIQQKKLSIAKENRNIINEALKDHDQREIEHEDYSGKPSGVGTIVDSIRLPNTVKNKSPHLVD